MSLSLDLPAQQMKMGMQFELEAWLIATIADTFTAPPYKQVHRPLLFLRQRILFSFNHPGRL
jgi:hypothetical protein